MGINGIGNGMQAYPSQVAKLEELTKMNYGFKAGVELPQAFKSAEQKRLERTILLIGNAFFRD